MVPVKINLMPLIIKMTQFVTFCQFLWRKLSLKVKKSKNPKFRDPAPSHQNWKKLKWFRKKIKSLEIMALTCRFQNTPWFWKSFVRRDLTNQKRVFNTFKRGQKKNLNFFTNFFLPERYNLWPSNAILNINFGQKMRSWRQKMWFFSFFQNYP